MEKDEILERMNSALVESFHRMSHRNIDEALECKRCHDWAEEIKADLLIKEVNRFVNKLNSTKYFWQWK